ncbi:PRA1 family domain-containing protein [Trichoderma novae-zelandiae]
MSRIQIPLDLITSRLNLGERFQGLRAGPLSGRFSNLRPISEFFDFKRLSKPANFGEVQSRVNYNLSHFSSNYAVLFLMLSVYALLTNWLLLFDIIFVMSGMFCISKLEGRDLEIGTFKATTSQLWTGLLVISIPIGLISSPFSTLLWLIGASGASILGHASFMDKPIDEAFSGEARATSGDAAQRGGRVEELASDEDGETGEGGIVRRDRRRYDTEDEDDSSSGDSYDEDHSDDGEGYVDEVEETLVQKALYRIEKAQAKGRADVRLSKEEIAALERRQKRMEAEERRNRRRRQERVAIPLAQFGSMARLGSSSSRLASGSGSLSRQPSGSDALEEDEASPQMGYFPPHSSSRRPKSGSSTSRPSSIHEDTSKDPFNYLTTTGPRASNSAPKRHGSGQSDLSSMSRRGRPESASGWSQHGSSRRQSSDETSEELALAEAKSSRAAKGREDIVVEVEPESPTGPEPASSRTRSASRKKPEHVSSRRTVSSRTTTSSGASSGMRRKRRDDAR